MKILIADDEKFVRLSLISMIEELYENEYSFIQVSNGADAIDALLKDSIDIAFLDVNMPRESGLDVLDKVICENTRTVFVIVSGYADFSYAQQALKYGVLNYLLKPASINDIKEVITACKAKLDKNNTSNSSLAHMEYSSFFNMFENMDTIEPLNRELRYGDVVFVYNDNINEKERSNSFKNLIIQIDEFARNSRLTVSRFFLENGEFCIILPKCKNSDYFFKWLNNKLPEYNYSFTFFTKSFSNAESLANSLRETQTLSKTRFCKNYGKVNTLISNEDSKLIEFSAFLEDIYGALLEHNNYLYKEAKEKLTLDSSYEKVFSTLSDNSISVFFDKIFCISVDCSTYKSFINSLPKNAFNNTAARKKSNDEIIDYVKAFVQSNYMNSIGINTIAENLEISPNYLSSIFKQKEGIRFVEYLTNLRITKAKELFDQNPHATVKSVAADVGYYSLRHFTNTFSKIVGCLPSEYVKR